MAHPFEMPVPSLQQKSGSNMPQINWLDYADNAVARLRREMTCPALREIPVAPTPRHVFIGRVWYTSTLPAD